MTNRKDGKAGMTDCCFYCNRAATTTAGGESMCQAHAEAIAYIKKLVEERKLRQENKK